MAQPKFTPGPWVRDGTLLVGHTEIDLRLDEDGDNWITIKGDDDATVEANAALVLASPDLYAALEAAEALLKLHGYPALKNSDSIRAQARAALRKADGDGT